MTQPELVDHLEIARRLRCQPDTVRKWVTRGIGFPLPHCVLNGGNVYRWTDVKKWAKRTGRFPYPEQA
jgi:hypothetical protein